MHQYVTVLLLEPFLKITCISTSSSCDFSNRSCICTEKRNDWVISQLMMIECQSLMTKTTWIR